jgi:hypothetical protein
MRKILTQLGLEPWEYELNSIAVETGMTAHEAKNKVVMEWMRAGDFRPLLWMIKKEGMLRQPIVNLLAHMIATGQLTFKKGRGRPPDPEAAVRDMFAADTYEDLRKDPEVSHIISDDLLDATGTAFGVSEEAARRALTNSRKSKSSR